MNDVVFLDAGPLGIVTNPKKPRQTVTALQWAISLMAAGHRFIVPSIADYEVRRELERAGKAQGLLALDAWNGAYPDRYLPLTDSALRLASRLWAQARRAGTPTADVRELDCDVLIAAQALDYRQRHGLEVSEVRIATVNVGHLRQFVAADLWSDIHPSATCDTR